LARPELYTSLYVPGNFIVPGGRFRGLFKVILIQNF
jgi:neutral trehalase